MFNCILQVLLVAPDAELAKNNETYKLLELDLKMPFVPQIETVISLSSSTAYADEDEANQSQAFQHLQDLLRLAPAANGSLRVKRIYYYLPDGNITIDAENIFCATLEAFYATIEIYKIEYGFTVS